MRDGLRRELLVFSFFVLVFFALQMLILTAAELQIRQDRLLAVGYRLSSLTLPNSLSTPASKSFEMAV
jgi:hypothetical protein